MERIEPYGSLRYNVRIILAVKRKCTYDFKKIISKNMVPWRTGLSRSAELDVIPFMNVPDAAG